MSTWLYYLETQDSTDIRREPMLSKEWTELLPSDVAGTWRLKTEKYVLPKQRRNMTKTYAQQQMLWNGFILYEGRVEDISSCFPLSASGAIVMRLVQRHRLRLVQRHGWGRHRGEGNISSRSHVEDIIGTKWGLLIKKHQNEQK